MDFPRINKKSPDETRQADESQNQPAENSKDSTEAAGARDVDSLQSAADDNSSTYFSSGFADGSSEGVFRQTLGFNEDESSIGIGYLEKEGWKSPQGYIEGGYRSDDVNADAALSVFIGAEDVIAGELSVGKDTHIDVGAGFLSGAAVRLEGQAQMPNVGEVHGGVEAWLGAGVLAEGTIGAQDGVFSLDVRLGLAGAIGGEVDFGYSVDFQGIADMLSKSANDASASMSGWLSDIGNATGDFMQDVLSTAGQATGGATDAAGDVVSAVEDTAQAVVDVISDAVNW